MSACCRGSSTRLIHSRFQFSTHACREAAATPACRLRENIYIPPRLRLCRSYATSTQSPIEIAAPFPPPSFGTIRQRLSHWQDQYGDRVAQIIRDHQAEDPTNAFINEFQTEVDFGQSEERRLAEHWDLIGEPGASLRRRLVAPGHLVEIM
jgi:hypothetical protein